MEYNGLYSDCPNSELIWFSNGLFQLVLGIQISGHSKTGQTCLVFNYLFKLDHFIHKINISFVSLKIAQQEIVWFDFQIVFTIQKMDKFVQFTNDT